MTVVIELHPYEGFSTARDAGVRTICAGWITIGVGTGSLLKRFRDALGYLRRLR